MHFKKFSITLFLIFVLIPTSKILAQTTNAGFVPGNIWYSEDPFAEGDKIKIYTLIFNPDTRKFSGTVNFYDNNTLLGTKSFNVSATSTQNIFINWTVTTGDHAIFAQIQNAKFLTSDGTYVDANLTDNKTNTSSRTVSSKIVAQNITNGINSVDGAFNSTMNSIQNIGTTAKNVVPTTISQSATTATNKLDGLRENLSNTTTNAQKQTQDKINSLNDVKKTSTKTTNTNDFQKPFAYIYLFFLKILSFIFKYKILFYGIIIIVIFFILRYIWQLIF